MPEITDDKKTGVTYDAVSAACNELFMAGEKVTFNQVYDKLGRKGSAKHVTDNIDLWRKELGQILYSKRHAPQLPDDLVMMADQLVGGLWKRALAEAEQTMATARAELEQERQRCQDAVDTALARSADFEKSLELSQTDVKVAHAEIHRLEEHLAERAGQLAAAQGTIEDKDGVIAGLREDLGRLNAELAAERDRHATEAESLRKQQLDAMAASKRDYDGMRIHLMSQTDSIRQAAREAEQKAQEAIAAAREKLTKESEYTAQNKIRADKAETRAAEAREQAAVARGEAELLKAQLAALTEQIQGMQRELGAASATIGAQAAQLEQQKAAITSQEARPVEAGNPAGN